MGIRRTRPTIDPAALDPCLRSLRPPVQEGAKPARHHPLPLRPGAPPPRRPGRAGEGDASVALPVARVGPEPAPSPRPRDACSAARAPQAWIVNWVLLLGTAGAMWAGVVAASLWHGHQLRVQREYFLRRANLLATEGSFADAAAALANYLRLEPGDTDARVRLAQIYDRSADTIRRKFLATTYYYHALGQAPERADLRARLCEILVELGGFTSAEALARRLLESDPRHPVGLKTIALCLDGRRRAPGGPTTSMVSVIDAYRRAVEANPTDAVLARRLADLYYAELDDSGSSARLRLADGVMDNLVAAAPQDVSAHLARFEYHRDHGRGDPADDLQAALALAPDSVDARIAAGRLAEEVGNLDAAMAHFDHAIRAGPHDRRGYLLAGRLQWRRGNLVAARDHFEACLRKVAPNDFEAALCLTDVLISLRLAPEAEQAMQRLIALRDGLDNNVARAYRIRVSGAVARMQAKMCLLRDDVWGAIACLRTSISADSTGYETAEELEEVYQSRMALGKLYARLQHWDLAVAQYAQASAMHPVDREPLMASAGDLESAGRHAEAAACYNKVLAANPRDAKASLGLLSALLGAQRMHAADRRDWLAFERVLSAAGAMGVDAAALAARESSWHLLQQRVDEALAVVKPYWDPAHPRVEIAGAMAAALCARRDFESALSVAHNLARHPEHREEAVLIQAETALHLAGVEAAVQVLLAAVEPLRPTITKRLVEIYRGMGRPEAALELLRPRWQQTHAEPWLLELAGDVALDCGAIEELGQIAARARAAEGNESDLASYLAARGNLLEAPPNGSPSAAAVDIHAKLSGARPMWPKTHLLGGYLALARGDFTEASRAFRRAMELGDGSPTTVERFVATLHRGNRLWELDAFVRETGMVAALEPAAVALVLRASAEEGQHDRAVALAVANVERHPKDARAQAWLAWTLEAGGKPDDAEIALHKGVALAPNDPRAWMSLLAFQIRQGRVTAARETLERIPGALGVGLQADRLLARGYELIGDVASAEETYKRLLASGGDDLDIQLRAASFFQGRDSAQAEQCLRRAAALAPGEVSTRRRLALFLIARGGERDLQEARALLRGDGTAQRHAADRRLAALALLRAPDEESRREARGILEAIVRAPGDATAADRLLLARLYEEENRPRAAREQLLVLASAARADASHVVALAAFLLRHHSSNEAAPWLAELERQEPDSPRLLALKARQLQELGRGEELAPLFAGFLSGNEAWLSDPGTHATPLLEIAQTAEEHALDDLAEKLYLEVARASDAACIPYARWLTRRGRGEDAVTFLEGRLAQGSAAAWRALFHVGATPGAGDGAARRVEKIASKLFDSDHAPPDVLVEGAVFLASRGERTRAEAWLGRVLQGDPRHARALNVLACVLLEPPQDVDAAARCLERAASIQGITSALADTRCQLEIARGRLDEAERFLAWLVREAPSDPHASLRQGMLLWRKGEVDAAKASIRQAVERGILRERLLPRDRALLQWADGIADPAGLARIPTAPGGPPTGVHTNNE